MTSTNFQNHRFIITASAILITLFLIATLSIAESDDFAFCSMTSKAALQACRNSADDDYWIAIGNCNNISEQSARAACKAEARDARKEDKQLCEEQFDARLDVCELVGEATYEPEIDPENFIDPTQIGVSVAPNPFFPLIAGTTLIYNGGGETVTVSVTGQTKIILGVNCAVVRDVVVENGQVIEDTEDWFAQDMQGNIWYFGEISQEFEQGELVSLHGSWKAGVDGAKPGLIMKSSPRVGDVYRQEFALGNAEDLARVLSLSGSAIVPAASCTNNCLITEDFTPFDPGVLENKYYAPGIGLILEINLETGKRVELVEIKNN